MFRKASVSLFRGCSLAGCTRNGACSMPMTRPSFAGTLLTMTQAIGVDQVGRLGPMRGARRGERSNGTSVPASQLATELLASLQKDERPLPPRLALPMGNGVLGAHGRLIEAAPTSSAPSRPRPAVTANTERARCADDSGRSARPRVAAGGPVRWLGEGAQPPRRLRGKPLNQLGGIGVLR